MEPTVKGLVIYYSITGNTEKVAKAVAKGLERGGLTPTIMTVAQAKDVDLYDYDFVCLGTPTHNMLPPQPVRDFAGNKMVEKGFHLTGEAPLRPGKYAAVFCTCTAIHDGLGEAKPAVEWLRSFLEHLGYDVKAKWRVVGEFFQDMPGKPSYNVDGRYGDVRGRPHERDLANIEDEAAALMKQLKLVLGTKTSQKNDTH